jgi:hypothetical protein
LRRRDGSIISDEDRRQPHEMTSSQRHDGHRDHSGQQATSGTQQGEEEADERQEIAEQAVRDESRQLGGRVILRLQYPHDRRCRSRDQREPCDNE